MGSPSAPVPWVFCRGSDAAPWVFCVPLSLGSPSDGVPWVLWGCGFVALAVAAWALGIGVISQGCISGDVVGQPTALAPMGPLGGALGP